MSSQKRLLTETRRAAIYGRDGDTIATENG